MKILLKILITALGVLVASYIVPGIHVASFWTAVLVAIVVGILNATVGMVLKVLTFPLTLATFGFFILVINAFVFWLATFVKGFNVEGFGSAFFGSLIVTIISLLGKRLIK